MKMEHLAEIDLSLEANSQPTFENPLKAPAGMYEYLHELATSRDMAIVQIDIPDLLIKAGVVSLKKEEACARTGGSCMDLLVGEFSAQTHRNYQLHITQEDEIVDLHFFSTDPEKLSFSRLMEIIQKASEAALQNQ